MNYRRDKDILPSKGNLKGFGLPYSSQGSDFDINRVKQQGEDELYKRTGYRNPKTILDKQPESQVTFHQTADYDRPLGQNEEEDLSSAFGRVGLDKPGSTSQYDPRELMVAQNLYMYSKEARDNNEPEAVVEEKIIKIMDEANKPNSYVTLISELWKTLTEILFWSVKLIGLELPEGNEIYQKILNLLEKVYQIILMIIFSPAELGEQAKKLGTKVKNYTIGLGVLILSMFLLYQTTYGKIVIDFFINITSYIIKTDIRLEAHKFYMYLQIQAEKTIAALGILNYIASLLHNAATRVGDKVVEQAGEKMGQVGEQVVELTRKEMSKQFPAITEGLVEAIKNPYELALITAGAEGGRQAALMFDNQFAEQAKLTFEILKNMATKNDLTGLENAIKLQLEANELGNILLTNQELHEASKQQIMDAISTLSDKIEPIMTLMEEDVKLLNVLIEQVEYNQQMNQEDIHELIRLTEESLKTTNLGRILNNWNTMDSKTVLYTLYTAVNGLNVLRGQNPINRQFLIRDAAGGRKTRKRRTKGKKKGATKKKKKIILKKSVKRKAMCNGKRNKRKGKTCKKK
jgi:hypothetical protein